MAKKSGGGHVIAGELLPARIEVPTSLTYESAWSLSRPAHLGFEVCK